ncbi:polysaccharide deacetylase family protein [Pseudoxanthomonas sp. Root630]|uniref:polysaccharide deacetylase family protein n=1 Tax=Pseudoxanthomonas sp. Root630 TaxID=1736574 RepID=UPI000703BC3F|nr:polysaccharide deacetylase family protein [Pseudoxanthomonas sp. Root630]KRA42336.1 polysaccharide deacetylase [Pseudoxanthomonas sp. Root630]
MNPRPRRLRLLRFLPNGWLTTSGPKDASRCLYITFDDGPHPAHTPAMLDLLAEHGVKASFFLVGREVERHDALARRIASEGHTLGNHSYSHPRFESLTLGEQLEEIERTERLLKGIDGRDRHAFRPPRGVLTLAMLARLVRRRHRIDYWSYDSLDYSRRPVPELLETIQRHPPRGGDIILMHDDSEHALALLRELIPAWKAQGFELRALPHLH